MTKLSVVRCCALAAAAVAVVAALPAAAIAAAAGGDTPTWRALPGEGGAPGPFRPVGRGAGMGEREPDRYGERPEWGLGGVGIPRDEGGFGASRCAH